MVAIARNGPHFTDPWLAVPFSFAANSLAIVSNTGPSTVRTSDTTAFFTEAAISGLQEQTNWTANTYKTLLSVSSGKGLVSSIVGCTAGGAETTTFEITVDGVLGEYTITSASAERAVWSAAFLGQGAFTTASANAANLFTAATSATTYSAASPALNCQLMSWPSISTLGTPCLRFNNSLLIRAKHSTSITNSTATAYSAVLYRLGLAA